MLPVSNLITNNIQLNYLTFCDSIRLSDWRHRRSCLGRNGQV